MAQDSYPVTFESAFNDSSYEGKRLLIPGGWVLCIRDTSVTPSQFIPIVVKDPHNEWKLET